MSSPVIPVVFATDENYVPYCGVAVSSLIHNACRNNLYEISVLYDHLSDASCRRLEQQSTDYAHVRCICIHDYITELKVQEYNHLTIASAYRLIIPDVLSQYEKILYLDSDIVVDTDIAELYNTDIGENILGAVHGYFKKDDGEFMLKHITQTLGIDVNNFFNAGILLMNRKALKENKVTEKCFSLLSKRTDLYFMDQCAMNIVCEGKVFFLPEKWNFEWQYLFSAEEHGFKEMNHLGIIHYDGIEKPWDYPGQVLAEKFWSYARKTIFYEEILQTAQIKSTRAVLEVFGGIGKFRNIAVYGAGNAGKRYVDKILSLKLCNIVSWVDKNYGKIQETKLQVESVETLFEREFDHVVIAIENKAVSEEVEKMLVMKGVPEEKVIRIC